MIRDSRTPNPSEMIKDALISARLEHLIKQNVYGLEILGLSTRNCFVVPCVFLVHLPQPEE